MNTSVPVLEASSLGVVLGGRPIVRDVDLHVRRGEVVAITGANGSGKSTLVRALLGLNPTAHGSLTLFGTPAARFRDWHRLGYVPQRSTIAQGVPATVAEVVASGRIAHRRPFVPMRAADRSAVANAIAVVGLADRAHHTIATLSGGQQQRVLVARALAVEPDLLVLDEPNAGVDLASQQEIANTLREMAVSGLTIVVVLHELGPFEPLIDRVVTLRDGRVVYNGPPTAGPHPDGHAHEHHPPHARSGDYFVQAPFDHPEES
ncbi:MAG TPA: ABC transporter ATP-binding protein [Marmoricola sp.]